MIIYFWLKIFILVGGVIKGIGIFVKWTDVFESVYELIEVCTKTVLSIILNLMNGSVHMHLGLQRQGCACLSLHCLNAREQRRS